PQRIEFRLPPVRHVGPRPIINSHASSGLPPFQPSTAEVEQGIRGPRKCREEGRKGGIEVKGWCRGGGAGGSSVRRSHAANLLRSTRNSKRRRPTKCRVRGRRPQASCARGKNSPHYS